VTPPAPVQFPYTDKHPALPGSGLMPFLPLTLTRDSHSVTVEGLLDTGATINVLPYAVGLQLGADWDSQTVVVRLGGNLAPVEARGLLVSAIVGPFPTVLLAFAWARDNSFPVILGQTNFFEQFEACFFRARSIFEIRPRA
jgi:hypothetical protein